jgi:nucleoside-diphosphate-sugar epimerase
MRWTPQAKPKPTGKPLRERKGFSLKVLVTGCTGFIGGYLLNTLLPNAEKIYCVVRDPSKLDFPDMATHRLHTVQGDLRDSHTFSRLPESIDVVIHLAASLGQWGIDSSQVMRNNVHLTENFLKWFKQSNGKQFIFISTPGVQGLGYKQAKETAPYRPRGLYEISKVLAEKKVINFNYHSGQCWTILRPDFVYGPGDTRRIKLYRKIKNRQWFKIGDGTSILRPTYVADVAQAILACMGHKAARNDIFNVAGPELVSVDSYTNTIAKLFNVRVLPISIPARILKLAGSLFEIGARITGTQPLMTISQVEFLTQDHGTDISKIRKQIGFSPRVGFEQGMRQTIKWAGNHNLL